MVTKKLLLLLMCINSNKINWKDRIYYLNNDNENNYFMIPVPINLKEFLSDNQLLDIKTNYDVCIKKCFYKNLSKKTSDNIIETIIDTTDNIICSAIANIILDYYISDLIMCQVFLYKYYDRKFIKIVMSSSILIREYVIDNIIAYTKYFYSNGLLHIKSSYLLRDDIDFIEKVDQENISITPHEFLNFKDAYDMIKKVDEQNKSIIYSNTCIAIFINRDNKDNNILKIILNKNVIELEKNDNNGLLNIPDQLFFSEHRKQFTNYCEKHKNKYIVIFNWSGFCVSQFTDEQLCKFISEYEMYLSFNPNIILNDYYLD